MSNRVTRSKRARVEAEEPEECESGGGSSVSAAAAGASPDELQNDEESDKITAVRLRGEQYRPTKDFLKEATKQYVLCSSSS